MKKSLLEIYALAVCLVSLVWCAVGLAIAAWGAVSFVAPEFTMNGHVWINHQTDEAFKDHLIESHSYREGNTYVPPEGQKLTQARESSFASQLAAERRGALQDLLQNLIGVVITAGIFLFHWKLAAKARQSVS